MQSLTQLKNQKTSELCASSFLAVIHRFFESNFKKSIVLSYDTKKPAVRQVFLLFAADSRFIPERGNPLGRTTKKPAVRQVFLLFAADSGFIPERGNPLGRTTKNLP